MLFDGRQHGFQFGAVTVAKCIEVLVEQAQLQNSRHHLLGEMRRAEVDVALLIAKRFDQRCG